MRKGFYHSAYDEAFEKHVLITKLGPLKANEVPPVIPRAFLEEDGSYGGGEVKPTILQACQLLKSQLASGILAGNENWHVYLLDADWDKDTYQLRMNDFRIKRPVNVIKVVRKNC